MTNNTLIPCSKTECIGFPTHDVRYHEADADVMAAADHFHKRLDEFFMDLREEMPDHAPHPALMAFGAEVEDEEDLADDFLDWFTMQVIRTQFSR